MIDKYKDITVVIHGRINYKIISLIKEIIKSGIPEDRIILSLWRDVDKLVLFEIQTEFDFRYTFINDYPSIIGKNNLANRYYATISSLFGLERVRTDIVIKFRGDEYYSNLEKIYDSYLEQPEKIITTNVFFRPTEYWPYHIGDHVMMGTKENMLGMFQRAKTRTDFYDKEADLNIGLRTIANSNSNLLWYDKKDIANGYDYYHQLLPFEMILTIEYLRFKDEIVDFSKHKELMNKYFNVINVEQLKPFLISHNSAKEYYRNVNEVKDVILKMSDIN